MRKTQRPVLSSRTQELAGALPLRGIGAIAAINQDIRINEGSHEVVPGRRYRDPRVSNLWFRESLDCLGSSSTPRPEAHRYAECLRQKSPDALRWRTSVPLLLCRELIRYECSHPRAPTPTHPLA